MSNQVPAQLQIPKLNGSDAAVKLLSRFGGSKPPSRPPLRPLPNFNNIRRASNEPLPALPDFSQKKILTAEKVEQNVSAIKSIDARVKYLLSLHAAAVEANCKLNDRAAQLEDANKLLNQELTSAQNHAKLREMDFAVRKDSYQKKLKSAEDQLERVKKEQQEINNTLQLKENELKSVKSKLQTSNESLAVVGVSLQLNLAARAQLERDINEQREVISLLTKEREKQERELALVQEKEKQNDDNYRKLQVQHLNVLQKLRNNQKILEETLDQRDYSLIQAGEFAKTQETLLNTIQQLREAKGNMVNDLSQLKEQLEGANLDYQKAVEENEQFKAVNEELERQLEIAEKGNAENVAKVEGLAASNAKLQDELKESNEKYSKLNVILKKGEESLKDTEKKLLQAEREIKAANDRAAQAEKDIKRTKEDTEAQKLKAAETEAQLKKVEDEGVANLKQMDVLVKKLRQVQDQLNTAQTQTKETSVANEKLKTDIESVNKRKKELEDEASVNDKLKQQLEEANTQLKLQQISIEQSDDDKKRLEEANKQRGDEISELKLKLSEAALKQGTNTIDLEKLTSEITALNKKMEEDKKRIDELNAVSATNEGLIKRIKENEETIAKLREVQFVNDKLKQELEKTESNLKVQQEDSTKKQVELDKQKEEIDGYFKQLSELGEKNKSLVEQNESLNKELSSANTRAEGNSDQLKQLNKQLEGYKKTKETLESAQKAQQLEIEKRRVENQELMKQIEDWELRSEAARKFYLEGYNQMMQTKDALLEEERKANKHLVAQVQKFNSQLSNEKRSKAVKSGSELQKSFLDLQEEYNKLNERVKMMEDVEKLVEKQSDTLKEQFGGGASLASELGEVSGGFTINLQNLFTSTNTAIEKLTKEKEELQRTINTQTEALKKQKKGLKVKANVPTEGDQGVTAKLIEANERIEKLSQKLEAITKELQTAKTSLKTSSQKLGEKQTTIESQEKELKGYIEAQVKDREEAKELKRKLGGIRIELDETKKQLGDREVTIKSLETIVGNRNNTISRQKEKIQKLEEENADLRAQLENNQPIDKGSEIAEQEATIKRLQERIEALEREKEEVAENNKTVAEAAIVLNDANKQLREDIGAAANKNAELQEQLAGLIKDSENVKALGDVHKKNEALTKENQELLKRHEKINSNLKGLIEKIGKNVAVDDIKASQSFFSRAWNVGTGLFTRNVGDIEVTQKELFEQLDTIFTFIKKKEEDLIDVQGKLNKLEEVKKSLEDQIVFNNSTITLLRNENKSQINNEVQKLNTKRIRDLEDDEKKLREQLSAMKTENERLQLRVVGLTKEKRDALSDLQRKGEEYETLGAELEGDLINAQNHAKANEAALLNANEAIIDLFKAREESYPALIAFGTYLKEERLENLNKKDIEILFTEWEKGTERLGFRFDFSRKTVRAILDADGFEDHLDSKKYTIQQLRKIIFELEGIASEKKKSLNRLTGIPRNPTKENLIKRIKDLSDLILGRGPRLNVGE